MARSRNIKPGFFLNDKLAECEPLARLLFAGLWCIADREGRLEDRPKRIKAEVLPYDDCDPDDLLNQLAQRGFIIRYEVDGNRYIQITNFKKHQNPHIKEAPSIIPPPPEQELTPEKHCTSTVQTPEKHDEDPADSLKLIPDSLNPYTESISISTSEPNSDTTQKSEKPKKTRQLPVFDATEDNNAISGESLLVETATGEPNKVSHSKTQKRTKKTLSLVQKARFDRFWTVWPHKVSKGQAEITWGKLDPDDDLTEKIIEGVRRAIKYDRRFQPGGFMPHASTWLNAKGWEDEYTATEVNANAEHWRRTPEPPAFGSTAQAKNRFAGLARDGGTGRIAGGQDGPLGGGDGPSARDT